MNYRNANLFVISGGPGSGKTTAIYRIVSVKHSGLAPDVLRSRDPRHALLGPADRLSDDRLILDACRRYRYAPLVFLAPPWKEIYVTDGERKQDFAEAKRIVRSG